MAPWLDPTIVQPWFAATRPIQVRRVHIGGRRLAGRRRGTQTSDLVRTYHPDGTGYGLRTQYGRAETWNP